MPNKPLTILGSLFRAERTFRGFCFAAGFFADFLIVAGQGA